MFHFAYGSNMHRNVMRRHAPKAEPVSPATLSGYSFVITADGYASIVPARTDMVHGVLWRITTRDRVTLDGWENVAGKLYRTETMPVRAQGRLRLALVYVARPGAAGRPKSGYMELVVAAARQWQFPPSYIASLEQWLPRQPLSSGHRKLGEFGCT